MPIYEFACQSCGHEFEHMQSFSAQSTPTCTHCNSSAVVRRLGRPAIHFKGSGWYITDSKKNGAASAEKNGADKNGAEKSSDPAAKKTESKSSADESTTAPVAAD